MKKINLLVSMFVFAAALTSCSSDDDNNNDSVGIAGTYNLSAVNTETTTDFNEDGTFSANQMDESGCYDNSRIVLHSDNTFTYNNNTILVNETDGTSACSQSVVSGTWSIYAGSGTTAIINATYENANGNNVVIQLNKQGDELTLYTLFGQYPDRNAAGGATYTSGDLELVFTK